MGRLFCGSARPGPRNPAYGAGLTEGGSAMQDYSGYGQPPLEGYGDYGFTSPLPPMPPGPPPRRRSGMLSHLIVALLAGALGAGLVVAFYSPASSSSAAPQAGSGGQAPAPLPSNI